MMEDDKLLEVSNITKYYGQQAVLKDVSFSLEKGQVLGLVGANGSGKSTLLNILYGNPIIKESGGFFGEVKLMGEVISGISSHDAMEKGIAMVHQEFALFNDMSVAENIKLCKEETGSFFTKGKYHEFAFINESLNVKSACETLTSLGITINPRLKVKELSTTMKQFIEIARELNREDLKLLILDEPTAVLNAVDSEILMKLVGLISKRGIAVIFVSHRLDEVIKVSDKIIVLRDGEQISCREKEACTIKKMAIEMVGEIIVTTTEKKIKTNENILMSFKNYKVDYPGELLKGLTLDVYENEIVGITSLSGQGKLAIGKGIMGFYPSSGELWFQEENISKLTYSQRIKKGISVLCEDRKEVGLLLEHSIKDNIGFTANQLFGQYKKIPELGRLSPLNHKSLEDDVNLYKRILDIKFKSHKQALRELSGGNQQKVALARCLATHPKMLIISEPTRGIDIAAKELLLSHLKKLNSELNMTLIIASSELDELRSICDRIVVLSEGICHRILPPNACPKAYGLALSGLGEEDE